MYFWERKTGFGIAMKKCGMRDSREKGAGMRDQDPPSRRCSYFVSARNCGYYKTKLIR